MAGKKIAVAMSGGVDSSVATYQLQQAGYDVHAVFILIRNPAHIPCRATEDRLAAMRAAAQLRIPFLEYDATEEYRTGVLAQVIDAYAAGQTPNPDVLCNTAVKFGVVRDYIQRKGFTSMATGHYAQTKVVDGEVRLYRSVDEDKDQTYFIHAISTEALQHTLFPVGQYTKQQVRSIAKRAGLVAAEKKDSTGLCFLGDVSMKDFLAAYIPAQQGEVRSLERDTVIGFHSGVAFYTLGQRHGFTLYDAADGPAFVQKKDVGRNILWVGDKVPASPVARTTYQLRDIVMRQRADTPLYARFRHRGDLLPVSYDGVRVVFESPCVVAAGQSVVLYAGDGECLGGGVATVGA